MMNDSLRKMVNTFKWIALNSGLVILGLLLIILLVEFSLWWAWPSDIKMTMEGSETELQHQKMSDLTYIFLLMGIGYVGVIILSFLCLLQAAIFEARWKCLHWIADIIVAGIGVYLSYHFFFDIAGPVF